MAQIEIKIVADTVGDAALLWRVGQAVGAPEVAAVRTRYTTEDVANVARLMQEEFSDIDYTKTATLIPTDPEVVKAVDEFEAEVEKPAEPAKRRGRPPKEKPPADDAVLAAELAGETGEVVVPLGSGTPITVLDDGSGSGQAAEPVAESQSEQTSSAPAANTDLFGSQIKAAVAETKAAVDLLTPKTIVEANKDADEAKAALVSEANGDITLAVLQAKATSLIEKSGAKTLIEIIRANNDGNAGITSLPADKYETVYAKIVEALG